MNATRTFAAGLDALDANIAADVANAAIDPRCIPILRHHGHRTERAIVLFHGFTNCPRQFARFAELVFAQGFTVYVPRLPHHGLRDKLTTALEALTIEELTTCAESAVAALAPFADNTAALGLSVGATMVAWLAQTQALARAVAIAPFFSVAHVPSLIEPALAGTLGLAPNVLLWWDPVKQAAIGPAHGYPRFPTHALARCLELGGEIRGRARTTGPLTKNATLVLNAKDPAIDNAAARDVWNLWRERVPTVGEYIFEDLDTRHDIIEPETYPDADTLVYPVLLDLLGR